MLKFLNKSPRKIKKISRGIYETIPEEISEKIPGDISDETAAAI